MENNFIYGDRAEGKTEFITKLANDLYTKGKYNIDFYSMISETKPRLEKGIGYNKYLNNLSNSDNILNFINQKIRSGKLDIIFIDDINHLDEWRGILSLECDKYITVNMPDITVNKRLEKLKNKINYNLFSLSEIQHNDFLKPYLRDRKLDILLK